MKSQAEQLFPMKTAPKDGSWIWAIKINDWSQKWEKTRYFGATLDFDLTFTPTHWLPTTKPRGNRK